MALNLLQTSMLSILTINLVYECEDSLVDRMLVEVQNYRWINLELHLLILVF